MLFELPRFDYVAPKNIQEAVSLVQQHADKVKLIAGGTDLLSLMKDRVTGPGLRIPEILVDIKSVPEMTQIREDGGRGLWIGAAVTLYSLETSDVIRKRYPLLSQAASRVGTTQLRRMGTVGGNLCQRPRCMYFRHPHFPCYKKGGKLCYAIAGEHRYYHAILGYGRCVMAHPSDLAPALVALKAKAAVSGPGGQKRVALEKFFLGPNHLTETVLQPDEVLTGIEILPPAAETYQSFSKLGIRHSSDFALASAALAGRVSAGVCEDIRVVLGGVAPFPYIVSPVEDLLQGKKKDEGIISKAVELSVEEARPLAMNGYKINLTKALLKRVLMSLWQESAQA